MLMGFARAFGLKDEVAHDAVLLMDRAMASSQPVPSTMQPLLTAACLLISARQGVRVHLCFLL